MSTIYEIKFLKIKKYEITNITNINKNSNKYKKVNLNQL